MLPWQIFGYPVPLKRPPNFAELSDEELEKWVDRVHVSREWHMDVLKENVEHFKSLLQALANGSIHSSFASEDTLYRWLNCNYAQIERVERLGQRNVANEQNKSSVSYG